MIRREYVVHTAMLLCGGCYVLSTVLLLWQWEDVSQVPSTVDAFLTGRPRSRALMLRVDERDQSIEDDDEPHYGDYPQHAWRREEFECLGWVETNDAGEPTGHYRDCWQRVRGGDAGYCEVRNRSSGDIHRVMETTSLSLKEEARFTCQLAKAFTDFRNSAVTYTHDPPLAIQDTHSRGIVMAVYDPVLPSAYASIRRLRAVGCTLPIEIWTRHEELAVDHPVVVRLMEQYGPIYLRRIYDERIDGFVIKAHAVYYSSFTSVLLLDADNFAVQDPTYLFDSYEFRTTGAVFWPDFWHPGNTIFNVHAQSLLWELLDLEYTDMMEQESGQVLIQRDKSRRALDRLMYLATHQPRLLNKLHLVWGDKDLFRLAWLQTRQPFHFNAKRLPGALGVVHSGRQRFCGMSMAQYDLQGKEVLFAHRNTIKLTGQQGEKRIWSMLQEYTASHAGSSPPSIQSFNGERLFNETSCFGIKRFGPAQEQRQVEMRPLDSVSHALATLESELIEYAVEATGLLLTVETEQ